MAYLGNVPARSFISFERQVFTIVNSQTAYTLDHSVTNENDIRLVVNNVVQEPGSGKAYTASGTTLTLSAALTNGTDEMYCVFLGRAVGTVNAPAGSVGTSQIVADAVNGDKIADDSISDEHLDPTAITGQTAETSIASDDLILLSDTSASGALKKMTRANFVSGVGGAMTPAFAATLSADQSLNDTTWTKIEVNTELFDTDNCYDNSTNYRFTPTTAGKYFVYGQVTVYGGDVTRISVVQTRLKKNGSTVFYNNQDTRAYQSRGISSPCSAVIDFNGSSDYVELHCYISLTNTSGSQITGDSSATFFGAYKLIE